MSDEDEPTLEEIAEAEALARALEATKPGEVGRPPTGPAPEDALGVAAMLRHARATEQAGAEPARARLAAASARVLPAVDARRPRLRRWSWLVPVLLVPAAAAILVVATLRRAAPDATSSRDGSPLPPPPIALLEAQARAARGREDLAALDREMRDYRTAFYAALATREGQGGGR